MLLPADDWLSLLASTAAGMTVIVDVTVSCVVEGLDSSRTRTVRMGVSVEDHSQGGTQTNPELVPVREQK